VLVYKKRPPFGGLRLFMRCAAARTPPRIMLLVLQRGVVGRRRARKSRLDRLGLVLAPVDVVGHGVESLLLAQGVELSFRDVIVAATLLATASELESSLAVNRLRYILVLLGVLGVIVLPRVVATEVGEVLGFCNGEKLGAERERIVGCVHDYSS
jgi:hypothetical protein